jgi:hypothetical protein
MLKMLAGFPCVYQTSRRIMDIVIIIGAAGFIGSNRGGPLAEDDPRFVGQAA